METSSADFVFRDTVTKYDISKHMNVSAYQGLFDEVGSGPMQSMAHPKMVCEEFLNALSVCIPCLEEIGYITYMC